MNAVAAVVNGTSLLCHAEIVGSGGGGLSTEEQREVLVGQSVAMLSGC